MIRRLLLVAMFALPLASLALRASAELRVPNLFSDGVVLQQSAEVTVHGWDEPGFEVRASSSWGADAFAHADEAGRWELTLSTPEASFSVHSVRFVSESGSVDISGVLIGEVWLASGQSNMNWRLDNSAEHAQALGASHGSIRFFQVADTSTVTPADDLVGEWVACTPEHTPALSAVAYWHARSLADELDVPIGIVQSDWGGTRVDAWMPAETLREFDGYDVVLGTLDQAAERLEAGLVDTTPMKIEAWYQRMARRAVPVDDSGTPWTSPDLDDSGWDDMTLPGRWGGDLAGFDGLLWHRITLEVPEKLGGVPARLSLGPIDDCDRTWVNGVEVGRTMAPGQWRTPREYSVPGGVLRAGGNTIAIAVLDTRHSGGLRGESAQLRIEPRGGDPIRLDGVARWRIERTLSELPRLPREITGRDVPSTLFNGMIAPLRGMPIAGVIWYQGESDRARADGYGDRFAAMIGAWRRLFDDPELHFSFVQLPPFDASPYSEGWVRVRDEQARVNDAVPATSMVVTLDLGDLEDIHPTRKRAIGERLAANALRWAYGRTDIATDGPRARVADVTGAEVVVQFEHADGLRSSDGRPVRGFRLVDERGGVIDAAATVDGRAVRLAIPSGVRPTRVEFASRSTDVPNLESASGLPASPFRMMLRSGEASPSAGASNGGRTE